jgi:hypothetical protein
MVVHDDRHAPKLDQFTFGIGGKLGLQTPEWNGWRLRGAYYITDDLGLSSSNPKKTDAYMFDVDKQPYSILGEAALVYEGGDSTLILGRQEIDTPIVSTYDYRIIPNLFEAYTYTNHSLPNTSLTLSYITKMSGLDGLVSFKHFESMSQQTYTSLAMSDIHTVDSNGGDTFDISTISGDQGVVMSGFVYDNGLKIQGWNYYCHDVLNETYVDLAYPYPLQSDLKLILELQGYGVRELGRFKAFLHHLGLNGSYELYGTKLSLVDTDAGVTASLAYNFFTGDAKTVTAFGNWGGYPEYVSIPYMFPQDDAVSALSQSHMGKINLKADLETIGLPNHTMIIGYSIIDLEVMPQSDIRLVNFVYRAKVSDAVHLKAQYEMRESDNYRYANDMLTLSATYRF